MSNAGKYREQVTFHNPGPKISDGAGGRKSGGPGTSVTHWARVQVLPAKEDFIDNKISYRQPYKVSIRFTSTGIGTDTIMEWNGQRLSVTSIVRDERTTELHFTGYAVS